MCYKERWIKRVAKAVISTPGMHANTFGPWCVRFVGNKTLFTPIFIQFSQFGMKYSEGLDLYEYQTAPNITPMKSQMCDGTSVSVCACVFGGGCMKLFITQT